MRARDGRSGRGAGEKIAEKIAEGGEEPRPPAFRLVPTRRSRSDSPRTSCRGLRRRQPATGRRLGVDSPQPDPRVAAGGPGRAPLATAPSLRLSPAPGRPPPDVLSYVVALAAGVSCRGARQQRCRRRRRALGDLCGPRVVAASWCVARVAGAPCGVRDRQLRDRIAWPSSRLHPRLFPARPRTPYFTPPLRPPLLLLPGRGL